MKSPAATVEQYLASLPADRRDTISAVRQAILNNLDADYEEGIQYGMIGYYVPHRIFPAGYHCDSKQPLPLAALGSQKNYLSLHLMCAYSAGGDPNEFSQWFQAAWRKTGKKLDMGKACIRFKSLDDVPLEVIGEAFRHMPAKKWIGIYTAMVPASKASAKKSTKKSKRK